MIGPFLLGDILSLDGIMLWFELLPFDNVYELGSRADLTGCWEGARDGGANDGVGGGDAGVDCFNGDEKGGGGGGGTAGEFEPLP